MKFKFTPSIYGLEEFAFGIVRNRTVLFIDTCKELFIDEIGDPKSLRMVAGIFDEQKNQNLNVLNSFETEFSIAPTKILELDDHYCVIPVSAKWKRNHLTLGLFLCLFRASMLSVRPNWRLVKHWDMPLIYKHSKEKIKALWTLPQELIDDYGCGECNCLFFLNEFDANEWFYDSAIELNKDNLPLMTAAVKFQNL